MEFSDQVKHVALSEGISKPELEIMVTKAAITSLRGASRRYHQWLFVVTAGGHFVERMFRVPTQQDTFSSRWGQHHACNGWGCKKCGWYGKVPVI